MGRITDSVGLGSVVAIDAAVFVYHLEADLQRAAVVEEFFVDVERGSVRGVASVMALLDVLVRPLRLDQARIGADYEDFFLNYPNLALRNVTQEIARSAAEIRARQNFPTLDSIHLATALESRADCFLTNDRRLSRFPSLPIFIIDDFVDSQNGAGTSP